MLSAKPWKVDAIIRLVLSVFVCVYAGSLLLSAGHYASAGGKTNPRQPIQPKSYETHRTNANAAPIIGVPIPIQNIAADWYRTNGSWAGGSCPRENEDCTIP